MSVSGEYGTITYDKTKRSLERKGGLAGQFQQVEQAGNSIARQAFKSGSKKESVYRKNNNQAAEQPKAAPVKLTEEKPAKKEDKRTSFNRHHQVYTEA